MSLSDSLVDDLSHGPSIMFSIAVDVGHVYVDATRQDSEQGAGIEVARGDGFDIELTRPEQVDALVSALQAAKREVWR